jgi:hypothetical protein
MIDDKTTDPNCKSIWIILAHVVSAEFAYVIDIRHLFGEKVNYPDDLPSFTVSD